MQIAVSAAASFIFLPRNWMYSFNLFEVEHSPIAQHSCGAGALLEVVIAIATEQASNTDFIELFAVHFFAPVCFSVCIIRKVQPNVNLLFLGTTLKYPAIL